MEWTLQQQGFDFCYDKRLYDRLRRARTPAASASTCGADLDYQSRLVRFLENHDEPRVAERAARRTRSGRPPSRSRPCPARRCGTRASSRAAGSSRRSSWPGGRTSRSTTSWPTGTGGCSRVVAGHRSEPATGGCCEAAGWPDNQSYRTSLAWSWRRAGDARHVVVVNLSDQPAQGRIPLPWPDLPGRGWRLTDLLGGDDFDRDGDELADPGLYVELPPWQFLPTCWRCARRSEPPVTTGQIHIGLGLTVALAAGSQVLASRPRDIILPG